jgi:DNA-binding phage protein
MEQLTEATLRVKTRPRFTTRLRHYVEGHGLRLSWIAKTAHMSYHRLYRLYSGATEPTVKEAHALARLLSCQMVDLFELEDEDREADHD